MLPNNKKIEYLVGKPDMQFCEAPLIPFDKVVCEFLFCLSSELMKDKSAKEYPDIISFAFWCRKSNVENIKSRYTGMDIRLGLGVVFHIAPSNVPINFIFSFVFSLLAGNANIVRVPTKDFPQVAIVCDIVKKLFERKEYEKIAEMSVFIKYEQDNEITAEYSTHCNARIIWGGDTTIKNIKLLPIPVRSIDIAFADRYSFCIMQSEAVLATDEAGLLKLARGFYNDTYLMDQNACSSPQLVVWVGNKDENKRAQEVFWKALQKLVVSEYALPEVKAIDKYVQLCENAIDLSDNLSDYCNAGNYIYRLQLRSLNAKIDELRGKCGYFYEYCTDNFNDIAEMVNGKYQTLTYFGVAKEKITEFVISNRLTGIDRIVPVGTALDISVVWDGYDLIRTLSRICDIK